MAWLIAWFTFALLTDQAACSYNLSLTLKRASLAHPLGFDAFGRDLFALVRYASISSAVFAVTAATLSCVIGLVIGTSITMAPKAVRTYCLRFLDSLLAFPSLLFALAWAALYGSGWDTLVLALLIGTVPSLTRLIYLRSLELTTEGYVTAALSMGASPVRIATKHLMPAVTSLCIIKFPNLFAHALMAEATLSFLGMGAPIGHETWGSLLAQGKDYLIEAPHIAIGSGVPLVLTVLSLQLLSERFGRLVK